MDSSITVCQISPTESTLENGHERGPSWWWSDSQVGFVVVGEAEEQRSDAAGSLVLIKLASSLAATAVLSEHQRQARLVHQPERHRYRQLKMAWDRLLWKSTTFFFCKVNEKNI